MRTLTTPSLVLRILPAPFSFSPKAPDVSPGKEHKHIDVLSRKRDKPRTNDKIREGDKKRCDPRRRIPQTRVEMRGDNTRIVS